MNNIDILEEKEKEAIKDLEEYLHWEELQGFSMLPRDKHIETLLNLVETLIAENKELKDRNKRQQENLKITNKKIAAQRGQLMMLNKAYIPKSKVEEVIEELSEELEIMKVDNMYGRYKEYGGKKKWEEMFQYKYGKHDVLQSLLGKE